MGGPETGIGRPTEPEKPLPQLRSDPDIELSVLIVNYNSGRMLADCLRSVYSTVSTAPMEVIVVDNDSTDGSAEAAAKEFPRATFILNDFNNWFTGGTNQAILASRGRYLLCLNPDTVCHPGAIDGLVDFMDSTPKAGVAGPRLLNGDGTLQPSCRKFLKSRYLLLKHLLPWSLLPDGWKRKAVLEYWDHGGTIRSDWVIGACILVRRKAVEEVGLKDEGFPMFHEETDWCFRMREKGWETWFLHTSTVTHFGSQSALKYWGDDLILEFYKGKHRFIGKHFGAMPLLLHRGLLAGLLFLRLIAVSLRRLFHSSDIHRRETAFLLKGIAIQLGMSGGPDAAAGD
ncbi:MAG: glycosyltransferase family 2 protein [Candidatus Aegiribacteria sp.]